GGDLLKATPFLVVVLPAGGRRAFGLLASAEGKQERSAEAEQKEFLHFCQHALMKRGSNIHFLERYPKVTYCFTSDAPDRKKHAPIPPLAAYLEAVVVPRFVIPVVEMVDQPELVAAPVGRKGGEGEIETVTDAQVVGPQADASDGGVCVRSRMPVMHAHADPSGLQGDPGIELAQVTLPGIEDRGGHRDLLPAPAEGAAQDAPGAAGMRGPVHGQARGEGAVDRKEIRVRAVEVPDGNAAVERLPVDDPADPDVRVDHLVLVRRDLLGGEGGAARAGPAQDVIQLVAEGRAVPSQRRLDDPELDAGLQEGGAAQAKPVGKDTGALDGFQDAVARII